MQLLKDWKNAYSTSRGSAPDADVMASIQTTGHSSGHSGGLNAEVHRRMGNSDEARSHRALAVALEFMRHTTHRYAPLATVFLNEDHGDAHYEWLEQKATEYPNGDSAQLYKATDDAIRFLTLLLLNEKLTVKMPERTIKVNHRTQSMQESYAEIARTFDDYCASISTQHKRFRSKAYDATAQAHKVSRNTVERAVHFINNKKDEDS